MKGQDLFGAWGVPNTDFAEKESKVPVTVVQYIKRDLSPQNVSEALELITEVCDCLQKNKIINIALLSFKTLFDTFRVLAVWKYLQLLAEGGLK